MRTFRFIAFLVSAVLVAACSAAPGAVGTGAPASAAANPPASPSASAAAPSPSAPPLVVPAMTTIQPTVIEVPGSQGVIWLTTDGTTIWAAADDAILRIDAATSKVTKLPAPTKRNDTTIEIAEDGLWMTRWGGGNLGRLDPKTGAVELSVPFASAVRLAFAGTDLWVGTEATREMVLVDRTTGASRRSIKLGAYGFGALGDLWFYGSTSLFRVDPASGKPKAEIDVQDEGNCGLRGSFPDNAWVTCFGHEAVPRVATRIDPVGNLPAVVARLPACHGGAVAVLDGQPWFVGDFEDAAGTEFGGLLRLNPVTGTIEQFVSIGPAGPDDPIVAGGAIWIPDEVHNRILRVDAAQLAGA